MSWSDLGERFHRVQWNQPSTLVTVLQLGRKSQLMPTPAQPPINVAIVARTLDVGGAERQIVNLARSIDRSIVNLQVLLLVRDARHVFKPELERLGVPVHLPDLSRNDPRIALWLRRQLGHYRIRVAHSFLWRSDAITAVTSMLPSRRRFAFIASERGDRGLRTHTPQRNAFDRAFTFRLATAVCANSHYGARVLSRLGCPEKKIVVIPNGFDIKAPIQAGTSPAAGATQCGDQEFVVGYVGRLAPEKGIETLIEAAALVRPEGDRSIRFVVVGDGPERNRLERLAAALGVRDRVHFLGQVTPALPAIRSMSLGVLPSRDSEASSNSIIEFMASEKPVAATNIGGNPELVVDGETGWLFEPGNAKALAAIVRSAYNSPAAAAIRGAAGRARIESEFSSQRQAERYQRLWLAACSVV